MDVEQLYQTPESNLETNELKNAKKYGFWKKFYISFLWGFPVFMIFVIFGTQKGDWLYGALGSAIFAFGSGILSMFVPAQRKVIFVPVGIIIGVLGAMGFGLYLAQG